MENIILRYVINPGDPQIVREISQSTGFFYPDEVDVTEELALECLNKGEASGYYFIFADTPDRKTLGYSCFGPIPCTKRSFDIYWIAVHIDYKGKGIGKQLIAETEKKIIEMGGKTIYLDTASRPLYEPTRQFYLRCSYVAEAQFKDYYDFGDDKIVFVKRF
jgi:ribosomal protein S18 acetylase RimI-like enzyme